MPVQMTIKTQGAELVRKGLQDLEAEVPKIARLDIYDMMLDVRAIMRNPGLRPSYPIRWDSDKQRRFVLAMLRENDNLPYRRTDELPKGWTIEKAGVNGYKLYNPATASVYVYGNFEGARQSRIHQGRHPVVQQIVEIALQRLPPDIEEHISYYGRQKGF
jgi:hypothetical protein